MEVERYEKKGYTIVIETDDDAVDPRKDYDHAGTMCCEHGRYDLGDGGMRQLYDSLCEDPRYIDLFMHLDDEEREPFEDDDYPAMLKRAEAWGYTVLPLYLYDHSGITMSCSEFSCPWDSGQVGIIFMSPQTAHKEGITYPEKVLKAEVEEYDQFLTGQVYGFRILDEGDDEVDACWGIFGEDWVKKEAEMSVTAQLRMNGEQLELLEG
jgi:hypothetical protein